MRDTKIQIRPMTEADLPQVMTIEQANFSVPWSEKSYRDTLQQSYAVLLVAEEAEAVIGYCGVQLAQEEGDILSVAVRKNCQGRGIGQRLVHCLLQEARHRGCKKIFLEVRESNAPAIAVYTKAGFVELGKRKNYYQRPTEDALLMMRTEEE